MSYSGAELVPSAALSFLDLFEASFLGAIPAKANSWKVSFSGTLLLKQKWHVTSSLTADTKDGVLLKWHIDFGSTLDNCVILTAHSATTSQHFWRRMRELFRENLRRYVAGEPLLNVVDKQLGY